MVASEIIFVVEESPEDGYEAKALGESIFTQAETLGELRTKGGGTQFGVILMRMTGHR